MTSETMDRHTALAMVSDASSAVWGSGSQGAAFNAPFHALAGLPRELWLSATVCSSGPTAARLGGLAHWRSALLAGELPDETQDLGDPQASGALRRVIGDLALTALTQDSEPLTVQVLRTALWHLDTLIDRPAGQSRDQAIDTMAQAFRDEWTVERQGWEEALALLRTLGDLAHLRWDELKGRLNSREWREAQRIGELLRALPGLAAFIDQVGRAKRQDDLPPRVHETPRAAPPRPLAVQAIEIRLADQPGEVRGIKRSGLIARMLASEAALIRHPVLHRLWRARLAESQLLSYEDEAVLTQWVARPDADRALPAAPEPAPRGQGPMIVCLDTSGSMRGAPENVAKACVLQTLRTAHAAKRACRLLAFGGPDELVERELALTVPGLDALLAIMGQSFDGGTDVQTPLERATTLVHTQAWALADILIVSDGEFGVTPATLAALRACKADLGLRVHGILIGDRETIGLLEVCDTLHWVRDWRRYASDARAAHADGFSPVHSRSLTALYFPNAIRR
jgi:uncharacterized protein with von Willebrand factor type A (vWA) domain